MPFETSAGQRARGERLGVLAEAMRTRLWPLPTVAIVVSILLAVALTTLDHRTGDSVERATPGYLFDGGPEAARSVLEAIAGSLMTVTSLTFSLTVVTLQLASSQYSPRLLRTFSRDLFVQSTLALFLGTFAYSMTVLRAVRNDADGRPAFVPETAVTVALVLTLAAVLMLVLFLAHLAREIRVETMLARVHAEASATQERVLVPWDDAADSKDGPEPPMGASQALTAGASGVLTWVDQRTLTSAAREADVVVRLDRSPGELLLAGTPIGVVWRRDGSALPDELRERAQEAIEAAVHVDLERTAAQDVGFGLRQLADVVAKAMSPGINDPTTAVHALGHAGALLRDLAGRATGPVTVTDDDGVPRLVLARPGFSELLDLVVSAPVRYGARDADLMGMLYDILRELARDARPPVREAVALQLDRTDRAVGREELDEVERERLRVLSRRAHRAAEPPTSTVLSASSSPSS